MLQSSPFCARQAADGLLTAASAFVWVLGAAFLADAFQPAWRILAGERLGVAPACRSCRQRVLAELVLIVEILLAHRQREHALSEHPFGAMNAAILGAEVNEALRQTGEDVEL